MLPFGTPTSVLQMGEKGRRLLIGWAGSRNFQVSALPRKSPRGLQRQDSLVPWRFFSSHIVYS